MKFIILYLLINLIIFTTFVTFALANRANLNKKFDAIVTRRRRRYNMAQIYLSFNVPILNIILLMGLIFVIVSDVDKINAFICRK